MANSIPGLSGAITNMNRAGTSALATGFVDRAGAQNLMTSVGQAMLSVGDTGISQREHGFTAQQAGQNMNQGQERIR